MLNNFPWRTLDELDEMDALRFLERWPHAVCKRWKILGMNNRPGLKRAKTFLSIYTKFWNTIEFFREFEESLLNGEQYNPISDSSEE